MLPQVLVPRDAVQEAGCSASATREKRTWLVDCDGQPLDAMRGGRGEGEEYLVDDAGVALEADCAGVDPPIQDRELVLILCIVDLS